MIIYIYIYIYIYTFGPATTPGFETLTSRFMTWGLEDLSTPSPRYKISRCKTFAKGWVAQKYILIGNYRSGVIFSKGWVRKDENLITWIGCTAGVCEKKFLLREPRPCDPAAEAAIQPRLWCFQI